MKLYETKTYQLPITMQVPGVPLWRIVPTRDSNGVALHSFMLLIPGFNKQPSTEIEYTLANISRALKSIHEIAFLYFNPTINVLWVSTRLRNGIAQEIAGRVKSFAPGAVLVDLVGCTSDVRH